MNSALVSWGWNESSVKMQRTHDPVFDAGQNVTGCAIQANQPLRYRAFGQCEADHADVQDRLARLASKSSPLVDVKPVDLPVEQPTKFVLVLNLTTAKVLGLKITDAFMMRADEMIE
jgi:hypothetical protein